MNITHKNYNRNLHLAHIVFDDLKPGLLHIARVGALGIGLAVGASIFFQVLYPRTMTLPQTTIGGRNFGLTSRGAIQDEIAKLNGRKLIVSSGEELMTASPYEVGIMLDGRKEAEQVTSYSWRERLTPFSFFTEQRTLGSFGHQVDESKAREFAQNLAKYNKAPINAVVKLEGTNVSVERGQTGYTYDEHAITEEIKQLKVNKNMVAAIDPQVAEPEISDPVAEEAAKILKERLSSPLKVGAAGKSVTFDQATLATWAQLTPDPTNKKLHVTYDRAKIKAALKSLEDQLYIPATPKGVTMVDNVTVGSTAGADGRAMAMEPTADAVLAALTENKPSAEAKTQAILAPARVNRGYTRSSKGMQALLDYWSQSAGGQWGVVMRDFNGTINAAVNQNRQFTSASVYKLYVAYVIHTKADSGQISLNSPTSTGRSVDSCLEVMIVRSDNPCGEALGNMIGWSNSNGQIHAAGMPSTSIAWGGQLTTAQDSATYLIKLQNGTLLAGAGRSAIIDRMARSIYRQAIPAGTTGISVANKIGALPPYNHDVGIVYHPKGAYVLTVFTYGSSHSKIRELAAQIRMVMDQ